jgi:hypothetical protein
MLMIIFGAGASYDSAPYHPPLSGTITPNRPPLADELFSNREEFPMPSNCILKFSQSFRLSSIDKARPSQSRPF